MPEYILPIDDYPRTECSMSNIYNLEPGRVTEINFAENDRKLINEPTLESCRRMGSTHAAYGWACSPWGHWPEEMKAAYREGFKA